MSFDLETEGGRLEFLLLREGHIVQVANAEVTDRVIAELERAGWASVRLDGGRWSNTADMDGALVASLELPASSSTSGECSFDSLGDWLRGVAYGEYGPRAAGGSGTVIFIASFDAFHRSEPQRALDLLELLEDTGRLALLTGHRMVTLIEAPSGWNVFDRKVGYSMLGFYE